MYYLLVYFNVVYVIIINNIHNVHILTKTMDTPFITDKERFVKFLELLPEEAFDNFLNYELYNLRYSSEYFKMIEKELARFKSVTSKFNNQDINQKYTIFNDSLSVLRDFLVSNFKENYPGDGYYLPREELVHSKVNDGLYSIYEVVEKTYKDFIQSTNDLLSLSTEDRLEGLLIKGKKRITLPHFKATDWGKITIRFISEQDVYIEVGKGEGKQSDYQSLGFSDDKNTYKNPNKAWEFLLELARNNGETPTLSKPIPDTIKQLKKQISDLLKKLFKNDTDPFYEARETQTYKIKIILIPPEADKDESNKSSMQEYLESNNL